MQVHAVLLVQEFLTTDMADNNDDMDDNSRKHNQPIKPCTFGHVRASFLRRIELHYIQCKKLVQVALYDFLYNFHECVSGDNGRFMQDVTDAKVRFTFLLYYL